MKNAIKLLVATLAFATMAKADDIRLGEPGYGGSGCPAGSASVTLSPDSKALSILFDQYVAQAGGDSGKSIDRKSCNIAIPVHVPQGFSVSVFQVDYRGYTFVPRGAEARFNVEYFFAGAQGPRVMKSFMGPVDRDYLISNELAAHALVWSACGADVNLRVNTSMLARSNRFGEDTMATVDSADIQAGLVYHLQWRRCN